MLVVTAISLFIKQLLYAKHCSKLFTQQPHEVIIVIPILYIKKQGPREVKFPH